MMASKARLFGDDMALSAILATDDPREQNRLARQVYHFESVIWQQECEHIVLRGNLAKFSINEEMQLALAHTDDRRLAEASPHDKLWGIGLHASDRRASTPDPWCGRSLLGQTLEHLRKNFRQDIGAPQDGSIAPDTWVPMDPTDDTVFEVHPVTHLRLNKTPTAPNAYTATLSAFTDFDHAPEVLLAYTQRVDTRPIPEQCPDLIGGIVTMDEATFTTFLSLSSGVSATSRFKCHALLDAGSPQSFIHQRSFRPNGRLRCY